MISTLPALHFLHLEVFVNIYLHEMFKNYFKPFNSTRKPIVFHNRRAIIVWINVLKWRKIKKLIEKDLFWANRVFTFSHKSL